MTIFNPITLGENVYNVIAPGKYSLSTVTFNGDKNYITISGGKFNKKTGLVTAAISRNREFSADDLSDDSTALIRQMASVQVVFSVPKVVTTAQVDFLLNDIASFCTPANLELILQGAQ